MKNPLKIMNMRRLEGNLALYAHKLEQGLFLSHEWHLLYAQEIGEKEPSYSNVIQSPSSNAVDWCGYLQFAKMLMFGPNFIILQIYLSHVAEFIITTTPWLI